MTKPLLFTPLTIRDVTLRNRVVISPMATYSAVDGIANDWHLGHYARLALGGAASVMVEATAVTDQGRITNGDVGLWSAAHVAPLRRISRFMKSHGVMPSIQLAHGGRKSSMQRPWHGNGAITPADIERGDKIWEIVGPTADPIDTDYITPKALTALDLETLAQQWGEAAARAIDAGFEIIEIHNAHGYLVHQFLSPISNTRNDAFGGDFEGRTRFPLMIAEAVRAAVPKGTPVFLRVSAVDGIDGGWSMDDTVAYAKALGQRGVDLIDCSSGGLKGPATVARIKRSWGFQVPFAERVKRDAGVMSMAVGLILDPHHAEDVVQTGKADLVAIGREALVNPSWPQMAEIALGRAPSDAMDDWPVQYGWWLKHREAALAQVRRDFGDNWRG
jgi:2,4-dienoyl-CoA reductase-like NADH-dependent reductase (Old Yellow Enzyme family)